jgi:hypothetical protein
MAFEGANGTLGLRVDPGRVLVAGEEFGVGSKEPGPCVGINNPMTPALGVPNFGFKGPAVRSEVNLRGHPNPAIEGHLKTGRE